MSEVGHIQILDKRAAASVSQPVRGGMTSQRGRQQDGGTADRATLSLARVSSSSIVLLGLSSSSSLLCVLRCCAILPPAAATPTPAGCWGT